MAKVCVRQVLQKRISDRSGMAFPYNENGLKNGMGSTVHISEYEAKHPQLEPLPIISDPESLKKFQRSNCNIKSICWWSNWVLLMQEQQL